ncbi:MAG TPA: glycosyltransferase family 39 protein [Bacteroidia bacterium]
MEAILRPTHRNLILILGASAFILFKIPEIGLPYFWDEMAGYMSGVIYMQDHGISLLPSSVPPELSYGHPLLLHVVLACISKVFGTSVEVMHFSMLIFTIVLAFGVFFLVNTITQKETTGIIAFFLFLIQPIVVAQSTQVVLEVFLAMHVVYALYFYLRGKYFVSMLFAVFAVLTKETGLVLAIALLTDTFYRSFTDKDKVLTTQKFLLFAMPLLVFSAFLLLTKLSFGWFLNPTNVGKTHLSLQSMIQKTWDYTLEFSLIDQGRWMATLILLLFLGFYLKSNGLNKSHLKSKNSVLVIYVLGFAAFSSVADTLVRYFLNLIPFVVILFSIALYYFLNRWPLAGITAFLLVISSAMLNMNNGKIHSDSDMSFKDMVKTNQAVMDFVNSGRFVDDSIGFAFPLKLAPADTRYGYYTQRYFNADTSFSSTVPYRVYCSPGNLDWNPPDSNRYQMLNEFKIGTSKSAIYKLKTN